MDYKYKIGIDLDVTLNNLNHVWVSRYNKDYNDNLEYFKEWKVENCVKKECGKKIFDYLKEPGFFYNLDIQPNAKEVVNFLSEKYELFIVTAYQPETCLDKANWVEKYGLNIKRENIIFINNKGLLKLDYLIDDGIHNFESFTGKGLLFSDRQNEKYPLFPNMVRVNGWNNIKKYFQNELRIEKMCDNVIKNIKKL